MKKVIILGGGYGGLRVAKSLLEKESAQNIEVVLIDRTPYHSLKTEFYALSAGTASDKDVRIDFPKYSNFSVISDEILHVDMEGKKIKTRNQQEAIAYDYLVFALGAEDNYHGIDGAKEFTNSIQTINKARKTYERVNNLDSGGKVIIVGGGLSGVEMASELRESRPDLHITLLDRGESILRPFDEKIRLHATKWFEERNVEIVTHSNVDYVEAGAVCNNGVCILSDVTIWTAGVQPNKLARTLQVEKDKQGRIVIDEFHRIPEQPEIFVVGDCASLPHSPSAQLAQQQGEQVACVLNDVLLGQEPKAPGEIKLKGTLGSLGKSDGFGVFNDSAMVGFMPRLAKTGILWLHKRH